MNSEHSLLSSFTTGLLITLGDQKAILFYLGFFPAFVDMSKMSFSDTCIIVTIAIVAVGGPKLFYALLADRASLIFKSPTVKNLINIAAGSVMIAAGVFVMVKA